MNGKHNLAQPDDARLKAVLQQWPGLEPRADFAARVWQGIHAPRAAEARANPLWTIIRAWLTRLGEALRRSLAAEPAWVYAMAATAGIMVGVSMALSAPPPRAVPYSAAPLFHSQTLAGAYLTMASGGSR